MSRTLYRIGHAAARHPFRVLATWLIVVIGAFAAQSAFGGPARDTWKIPGAESQKGSDVLTQRFPAHAGAMGRIVFHTDTGRLTDAAQAPAMAATLTQAGQGQQVLSVTPPTVSADGRTAFSDVDYKVTSLKKWAYTDLEAAASPARAAGVQVDLNGAIAQLAHPHVQGKELVGLMAAVVVLLVAFGSVIATGIPIGTALFGIVVGFAGVGVLSGIIDVPNSSSILSSMIGLGVGIDYALFVVTRHRQHLAEGMSVPDAAGKANATAGQAVLFAGVTVVIAIAGLQLSGIEGIAAMGFATAIAVAVSVAAALTLIPALLGWAGHGIDRLRIHRRDRGERAHGETLSGRWAHHVGRHPWRYAVVSLVALIGLAAPLAGMRIGVADDGNAAPKATERVAYDHLAQSFGKGFNGPLMVVVQLPKTGGPQAIAAVRSALASDRGIASVSPAMLNQTGDTAVVMATPTTSPQDPATVSLVSRLRTKVLPPVTRPMFTRTMITGQTAYQVDMSSKLSRRLPVFIGAVVVLSFLLLTIVFRSLLVPAKAAVMNLLSIGAAYGVIVAVFQWGWGMHLFGVQQTVPVNPFVPMIMFAILFGLSMDYEVFLLSRVREAFLRTGDSHTSVVEGLGSTARVITSAALIMISVFLAFVGDPETMVKMFGVGLASAILIDATLVRMVLVPATMSLLGSANWWLPAWLDRRLPHLDIEGESASASVGQLTTDDEEEPLAA